MPRTSARSGVAAYRDFARSATVVDPATLCAGVRQFDATAAISWIEGYDLLRQEPCWVPAEIVHTDYTLPKPDGYFLAGSNGLASGNHLVEAINAALYELVERDAVALWIAQPLRRRARALSTSPRSTTPIAARSSPDMRPPKSLSGYGT